MRSLRFVMASLIGSTLVLGAMVSSDAARAQAQNQIPPISQRFTWEPIARIENPRFPIQIALVNQTGISLDYGFTDDPEAIPLTLSPDARSSVTLTDPSILLSVNPVSTSTDGDIPLLLFEVQVQSDNAIEVIIKPGGGDDLTGDAIGQVLDVQESGGIFVY